MKFKFGFKVELICAFQQHSHNWVDTSNEKLDMFSKARLVYIFKYLSERKLFDTEIQSTKKWKMYESCISFLKSLW